MAESTSNGKTKGLSPGCPHCGSGGNGVVVGPFWDFSNQCWRCAICGYRGYAQALRLRTKNASHDPKTA